MAQFTWKQVDPTAPKKPRALRRPNQAPFTDRSGDVLTQGIGDYFLSSPGRHPLIPFVLEDSFLQTPLSADLQKSAGTNDTGENNASIHEHSRVGDVSESLVDAIPPQTTTCLKECDNTSPVFPDEENNVNKTVPLPELAGHPCEIDTESAKETGNQSYPQISPTQISEIGTTSMADIESGMLFSSVISSGVYQDLSVPAAAPAAASYPSSPLSLTTQEPESHVGTGHKLKRPGASVNDTHCRKKRLMSEMRPVVTHQGDDCWDNDIPELFDRLDTMTNLSKVRLLLSILEGFMGSSGGETALSFNALPRCVRAEIWIRLLVGLGDEDELAGESPRVPQWFSTELLKGRSAREATWKRLREEISL